MRFPVSGISNIWRKDERGEEQKEVLPSAEQGPEPSAVKRGRERESY